MKNISEIMDRVDILSIAESATKIIGKEWMMITAGSADNADAAGNASGFNTMTASWGALGELWNKPVAIIFVRPQRHTFGFIEREDFFTLTFYNERYRDALNIAGTISGRDRDKVAEAGITPVIAGNSIAFEQGRLVMECRKLYGQQMDAASFTDKSIIGKFFPEDDFHKMYVGEIVNVWKAR